LRSTGCATASPLVFENQGHAALVVHECERPQRPTRIEIVLERHFLLQHPGVDPRRMLGGEEPDED
jgi:hypothetical protein